MLQGHGQFQREVRLWLAEVSPAPGLVLRGVLGSVGRRGLGLGGTQKGELFHEPVLAVRPALV